MSLLAFTKQRLDSYRRFFANAPLFRVHGAEVLTDPYHPALGERFFDLLDGPNPSFVARIGGSDYSAVRDYFNYPRIFESEPNYNAALERVQQYNGYFDVDHDKANFFRYLSDMATFYRRADVLAYAGPDLIPGFRKNAFPRRQATFLNHICGGKTLFDYTFIEAVSPFLASFKRWGEGKRILIVSPLSESLQHQYRRRDDLIVDYTFPDFELLTYPSPVTYCFSDDTCESLGVTTRNWHEECRRMAGEISELDFDIALLSCGSYAMYLGDAIRHMMGRSAIYTGGIINVLFNIYGERYDTSFFNRFMRPDTQVQAFENDDVASLRAGRDRPNEALRAYFGCRG